MTTTTPNFGWPVPTSTDLVKDGATAIEALGDAIDASLVDLEGGTTGQVLAKASNTDMDFTWTSPTTGDITGVTAGTGISGGGTSGDVTITNSMATAIDAKGDLIAGTGADAFSRLAVGADYAFLGALASESTGLKWNSDWTSWTPTINGATVGNGTVTAKYIRIGKLCIARFDFFLQSTSSVTGDFYFSLPFSAATGTRVAGFGMMFASIGVVPAVPEIAGSNMYLRAMLANSTYVLGQATSSTVPGTWATNNWLAAVLAYEVA